MYPAATKNISKPRSPAMITAIGQKAKQLVTGEDIGNAFVTEL